MGKEHHNGNGIISKFTVDNPNTHVPFEQIIQARGNKKNAHDIPKELLPHRTPHWQTTVRNGDGRTREEDAVLETTRSL